MKRTFTFLILILCLSAFLLISCEKSYSITYELDGGTNSENNPTEFKTGDIVSLDFPTKEGYMFAGWYEDADFTIFFRNTSNREENLTLYAKWVLFDEVIEFRLINEGYEVYDSKKDIETVTIPSTYNGLPVVRISEGAFSNCKKLEAIFISKSVTFVKGSAFFHCTSLKNIAVEEDNNSYKSLNGVLYSKDGKTLVCYPGGKTEKEYTIPQGTEIIGVDALKYNSHIAKINIPDSVVVVKSIHQCTALENIVFPDSVIEMGKVSECTSLKSVVLSSGVEVIEREAFSGCSSLESIIIPDNVKKIKDYAFYNCSSLKSIVIPISVVEMGFTVFSRCDGLTVYCEATSRLDGWEPSWHGTATDIVWGYKGE